MEQRIGTPHLVIGSTRVPELNSRSCSLPEITGERDCASRSFNCGFADGEAEAGAAGGARARRVGTIEAIKDIGKIDWIDAFTVILHSDFYRVFVLRRANFNVGLRSAVLDGVEE